MGIDLAVQRFDASKISRALSSLTMSACGVMKRCGIYLRWRVVRLMSVQGFVSGPYLAMYAGSGILNRLRCSFAIVFMTSVTYRVTDG